MLENPMYLADPNNDYSDFVESIHGLMPCSVIDHMDESGFIDSDIEMKWFDKMARRKITDNEIAGIITRAYIRYFIKKIF